MNDCFNSKYSYAYGQDQVYTSVFDLVMCEREIEKNCGGGGVFLFAQQKS